MEFGHYVRNVAKARKDVADVVVAMREDKKITDASVLKNVQKGKHAATKGFDVLVKRYNSFVARANATPRTAKKAA